MHLIHFFTAALVLVVAQTHVIMTEPYPYNLVTEPLYQNWPLDENLPFPCQGRTQHVEKITTMEAGSNQTVKLWGFGVHGGGSCQFSVAYHEDGNVIPADPSKWKTIYSIIGGCPAEAEGNLPVTDTDQFGRETGRQCGDDSGTECIRQFNIPVPKQLRNGNATFAWTWLNKIGNREMYMTCAPVVISGGTGDDAFTDSLPPMFRANIPGVCKTGESGLLVNIPNPGNFGRVYDAPSPGANGECPTATAPVFGNSYGSSSSAEATPTPATVSPATTGFVTMTRSPTATRTTASPETAATATSVATVATATSTACGVADGEVVCLADNMFAICNQGVAAPQALAPQQICSNGQISYSSSRRRRSPD